MNLNFYPPDSGNYLESLRNSLNEQIAKLDQLRNVSLNNQTQAVQNQQNLTPQRYYLDCGNKVDWQEFLRLNYNITEEQIFEDYKLFLQAKAELHEDSNKEKLQKMKDKLNTKPQAQIKENRMTQYADAATTNTTQPIARNNKQQTEVNMANNTERGAKHVR